MTFSSIQLIIGIKFYEELKFTQQQLQTHQSVESSFMKKVNLKEKTSFEKSDYEGASPSTLCLGCGHDQISRHIVKAFWELGLDPFQIAKVSGIGCSSKTPAYFLKNAKGFNTIHGRMACVATGLCLANRELKVLGISGDGDTGSIGLGSFLHTARRNTPMIYILENNGVYGLTKGQFSATAEKHSSAKQSQEMLLENMDLCRLALSAGSHFVARAFSGDGKQLNQLLKLALNTKGFAFIDVISPCVAYGNTEDFAHSFPSMKKTKAPLHEIELSPTEPEEVPAADIRKIPLPSGKFLLLKTLNDKNHDPTQKELAFQLLEESSKSRETPTGLIYYKESTNFLESMALSRKALVHFKEEEIRLKSSQIKEVLENYR